MNGIAKEWEDLLNMAANNVWSYNSGKVSYEAGPSKEVMIIVSDGDVSPHPDVVRRRPAIELTEDVMETLENQGIQTKTDELEMNDLPIVKARYTLDRKRTLKSVEISQPGVGGLTRERVLKQIVALMNNNDNKRGGILLHYIGDGRTQSGDWCFKDGYISFTDLASLYLELLHGYVLTIVSDCSHSGSWVSECVNFLDQQKVGPCGHKARDKGILLKVYTSCLSNQIPKKLAYSIYGCSNENGTGSLAFYLSPTISLNAQIADAQHIHGRNFARVRCGQKSIDKECLCLPSASWYRWNTLQKIYVIKNTGDGRKWWHIVLVKDDDLILQFLEKVRDPNASTNVWDYCFVLKSKWGEEPTDEERKSTLQNYAVYQDKEFETRSVALHSEI